MICRTMSSVCQPFVARADVESIKRGHASTVGWNLNKGLQRLIKMPQDFVRIKSRNSTCWRIYCTPASLEMEFSAMQSQKFVRDDGSDLEASLDESPSRCLSGEDLKLLITDSERSKLIKKLSEANNNNRILKRQLQAKEGELVDFRSELAAIELEIQALVALAAEVAKSGIPEGSRKINGKYIQSHLLSRLEGVHEQLKSQTKDVNAVQSKEVTVFWCGMAESVRIMGSFDGWSQGEDLSPEYTGSFTKFSTTLMLRPGRYEVKFLVDGEWRVSSEFPIVGEDWAQNNLLIIE